MPVHVCVRTYMYTNLTLSSHNDLVLHSGDVTLCPPVNSRGEVPDISVRVVKWL